jgi:hypothetical protein
LVATLPPIVEIDMLAGSGGYHSPYVATCWRRSSLMTPASTTAYRSATLTSVILVIFSSESTMQPVVALAPPDSPEPAPRGTTGTWNEQAVRTVATTSSRQVANTTAAGRPYGAHSASSCAYVSSVSVFVTTASALSTARRASAICVVIALRSLSRDHVRSGNPQKSSGG